MKESKDARKEDRKGSKVNSKAIKRMGEYLLAWKGKKKKHRI